jgi:hypothetical protein
MRLGMFGLVCRPLQPLLWSLLAVAASGLAAAMGCSGVATGLPQVGGESHFLHRCSGSCDEAGLDCISGLCTRPCLVAEPNACSEYASASCSADSIEPGAVAVCDVGCRRDGDCAVLGRDYRCEGSFCRAVEPVGADTSGSAGASGDSAQSPGAAATASGGTAASSVFACAECFESPMLRWTWVGGYGAEPSSDLTGCNSYHNEMQTKSGLLQCRAPVAGCPSQVLAVLNATLRDPEIQSGLSAHTVFGLDLRPPGGIDPHSRDGTVRQVSVGDRSLFVGTSCSGVSNCREIPPVVDSLVRQLVSLQGIEIQTEPCLSVFPTGPTGPEPP